MSAERPVARHLPAATRAPYPWLRLTDGQLVALKWIAFGSMLIVHFGRYAFGQGTDSWAFAIGRLAFPLFALVLASNLAREDERSARAWRTSRRLAVWALISVIPSWWARETWLPINVLATLSIGAALCAVLDSGRPVLIQFAAGAVAIAAAALVEFGMPGVLLVVAAQRVLVRRSNAYLAMTAAMLALTAGFNMIFGGAIAATGTFAALGVVLGIRLGRPVVGRHKWIFYFAYPLHLVAVAIAAALLKP